MTGGNDPSWSCAAPPALLSTIQSGVLRTRYWGRRAFLKSPFDVVLYLQLLDRLKPRTVIEIGTKEGGSALWFADTLKAGGIDARIISIDLNPPSLHDPRITFLQGDAADLGATLTPLLLNELEGPWLVIEDSAHEFETTFNVLEFFHRYLRANDYIVVEDGVVAFLPEAIYRRYENGPNRAVAKFLARCAGAYEVDRTLCDFYGFNLTYNPNGWLRRN